MYKDILAAIDIEHLEQQGDVLETAKKLAVSEGARLHVVSVVPDISSSLVGFNLSEKARQEGLSQVDGKLHAHVRTVVGDACPVQHIVGMGKVYEEVIKLSEKLQIDLIVMGAHRPAFRDYLLGSNAARVTRHATCSVFIVRQTEAAMTT